MIDTVANPLLSVSCTWFGRHNEWQIDVPLEYQTLMLLIAMFMLHKNWLDTWVGTCLFNTHLLWKVSWRILMKKSSNVLQQTLLKWYLKQLYFIAVPAMPIMLLLRDRWNYNDMRPSVCPSVPNELKDLATSGFQISAWNLAGWHTVYSYRRLREISVLSYFSEF